MRIQAIENNINSKGVYFTKIPNVKFDKTQNANKSSIAKVSEQGFRYVENKTISKEIKEKFLSNPFIKELSEKFDTFIFFREIPKNHPNNMQYNSHFSFAKISWTDLSKEGTEIRQVYGNSPISQKAATDAMFKNLENRKFSNLA